MAEAHVHKYQKVKLGRSKLPAYRCMLPDCNHYVYPEFLEGKYCICYICNETFIITPYATRLKRPHCDTCVAKGEKKKVETEPIEPGEKTTNELLVNFRERFNL